MLVSQFKSGPLTFRPVSQAVRRAVATRSIQEFESLTGLFLPVDVSVACEVSNLEGSVRLWDGEFPWEKEGLFTELVFTSLNNTKIAPAVAMV